jgi:cobalt/nickel transport system permease protein
MSLILGVLTFPAVLVALTLQSVLFGFGGLTTLGVNTVNMALPGVVLAAIFAPAISRGSITKAAVLAGICAGLAVLATGGLVAVCLALSSSDYVPSARILLATYVPLMLGEGVITGFAIAFIRRAKPKLLTGNLEV